MPDILFHQYANSPFSEKVRVVFGIKDLAWGSVDQPVIMPKPDLVALTGGYRRIPVMQIGADIYCDSVLIVRELERRHPTPSLFPNGDAGLAQALAQWTDKGFFQAAVTVIFGGLGDKVDPAFIKDREALSGAPFNPAAMKAAVPMAEVQLKAHVALLTEQLSDGRAFLGGDKPGLADANAWYNLWFVQNGHPPAAALFRGEPRLDAWMARVRGLGHGRPTPVSRTDAVAIARAATPEPAKVAPEDAALAGKTVSVSALDYGRDPITGLLVGSSPFQLSLKREDPEAGEVVVHLPRLGYALSV
jgi:glutathione S-transferase